MKEPELVPIQQKKYWNNVPEPELVPIIPGQDFNVLSNEETIDLTERVLPRFSDEMLEILAERFKATKERNVEDDILYDVVLDEQKKRTTALQGTHVGKPGFHDY